MAGKGWKFHEMEARKYYEEAERLAIVVDEADHLAVSTPFGSSERKAAQEAGKAMGELFDKVWSGLHRGGLDSEYDTVADWICSHVHMVTGINIRIFAH